MLELQQTWILWIAPLPLLVHLLMPRARRGLATIYVPFYNTASALAGSRRQEHGGGFLRLLCLLLIWLLALLACARPVWIGDPIELPTSGRDLLLAVDISASMEQQDMQVNQRAAQRIDATKKVVGEFVRQRQGDRLGLVLFGTQAYLQAPLTFDRRTVQTLLEEAQLGFAGPKTAIGDAIGLAVKRLRSRPDSSRVLILLTDGANTAGEVEPLQAAKLAQQNNIRIYTIGIGAEQMEIPGLLFGSRTINPSADLDEETLTEIADMTGGLYFRARNQRELEAIYEQLDRLEPVEQEQETYRPSKSLYHWPLGVAFILSLLLSLSVVSWSSFFDSRKAAT